MKIMVSICAALMLMLTLVCPAFAEEDTFVPSISEKAPPKIVIDDQGSIGHVEDENGNVLDKVGRDCLIIASVSQVQNNTSDLTDAEEQLLDVYQQLVSGEMTIPVEKLDVNPETTSVVIRELIDMSWYCVEHQEMVEPEGVYFQITLDLGIANEDTIHVMTYQNNVWNPNVKVVNNGDGTVTCTFESLCPVAFVMTQEKIPSDTGDAAGAKMLLWLVLLLINTICVTLYLWYRKNHKYQ